MYGCVSEGPSRAGTCCRARVAGTVTTVLPCCSRMLKVRGVRCCPDLTRCSPKVATRRCREVLNSRGVRGDT